MKKILVMAAFIIAASTTTFGEVKKDGNTYIEVGTQTKTSNEQTPFKYKDKKGAEYVIYLSRNGRAYVEVISKNGNKYKKYLGEEISRDICKQMGREYKETNNNSNTK